MRMSTCARVGIALRGIVACVALSGAALPGRGVAQLPPSCRGSFPYQVEYARLSVDTVAPPLTTPIQRAMTTALREVHRRAVSEGLGPGEVRDLLEAAFESARQADSLQARIWLAFLVVHGDALLPQGFEREDLSWLYFTRVGSAALLLDLAQGQGHSASSVAVLRAIRGPVTPAEARVVLRLACEAAWLLQAYHDGGEFEGRNPVYRPAVDAGFLLPHAMRLLSPEVRAEFLQVADQLYPPPREARQVLMGYTARDWEWAP